MSLWYFLGADLKIVIQNYKMRLLMESDDFGHVFDNFVRICSLFDFGNPEYELFST
jgi:hypothetical protein